MPVVNFPLPLPFSFLPPLRTNVQSQSSEVALVLHPFRVYSKMCRSGVKRGREEEESFCWAGLLLLHSGQQGSPPLPSFPPFSPPRRRRRLLGDGGGIRQACPPPDAVLERPEGVQRRIIDFQTSLGGIVLFSPPSLWYRPPTFLSPSLQTSDMDRERTERRGRPAVPSF